MSETTPKLCKNCAHATSVAMWVCRKEIDLVTGDAVACTFVRNNESRCGKDGKWFVDRDAPTSDAIETGKATIRREGDRPWEKGDYEK
jgi:hypothetical protein